MHASKLTPRTDEYPWGRMVWLIDAVNADNPDMSLARMEVEAGQTSEAHVHSNCHECIHVLSGAITEFIDNDPVKLTAGDTVFVPQGSAHYTVNSGEELAVVIINYSAQSREYEAIS